MNEILALEQGDNNLSQQTYDIFARTFNRLITKITPNGIFSYVSTNSEAIVGYSPQDLLGRKFTTFLHTKDRNFIQKKCEEIQHLNDDNLFTNTFRLRKKDGSYIWIESTMAFIYKQDSVDPVEIVNIIREVPVEHDELFRNFKLSVVGELAAGIAHEIRNPLTSLKGFIQLMKSDRNMNEQYLQIMEYEIDRIESIAKEFMYLARPTDTNYQKNSLQTIFESCMSLLEGEAFQSRVTIIRKFFKEDVFVLCDDQKIKQVMINLLKNALESMDQPGSITICIEKRDNKGCISIKDEGCGIPEEFLHKIGQPFFTTKQNGNGLGLMICYKIIEEHNGDIIVHSKKGMGTTFTITLPLAASE